MAKIETAEQVVQEMNSDKSYYQVWLEGLAIIALNNNKELLQSWLDWFNGVTDEKPDGKELV